jgi:hypothetical protein
MEGIAMERIKQLCGKVVGVNFAMEISRICSQNKGKVQQRAPRQV